MSNAVVRECAASRSPRESKRDASGAVVRGKPLTRSVMDRARQGSRVPFVVLGDSQDLSNDESSEEHLISLLVCLEASGYQTQ